MISYKEDPLILDKTRTKKEGYLTARNMPDKIIIRGNTLNLYSALVKSKDFEGGFSRFIYVRGEDLQTFIEELVNALPLKYKERRFLLLRNKLRDYAERKRLDPWLFERWFKDRKFPLPFLRVLSLIVNSELGADDKLFLAEAVEKIDFFMSSWEKSMVELPVHLDEILREDIMYFVGCAVGDGGLNKNYVWEMTFGDFDRYLSLANDFCEIVESFLKSKFRLKIKSIKSGNKYTVYAYGKSFCRFLNFFFDLPYGKKVNHYLTKPYILKLTKNEELIKVFWRGVYDTDGKMDKGTKSLGLEVSNEELIDDCSEDFRELGIKVNVNERTRILNGSKHDMVFMSVLTESFKDYATQIGFSYSKKRNRLLNHLREPPKRLVFKGLNKKNLKRGFYDLSKIKDAYLIINNKKLSTSDISVTELLDLKKKNIKKVKVKRGKGSFILPLEPKKEFNDCFRYIHPHGRGIVRLVGKKNLVKKINEILKENFGFVLKKSDRRFSIHSRLFNEFLRTYYNYGISWEAFGEKEIKELRRKLRNPLK